MSVLILTVIIVLIAILVYSAISSPSSSPSSPSSPRRSIHRDLVSQSGNFQADLLLGANSLFFYQSIQQLINTVLAGTISLGPCDLIGGTVNLAKCNFPGLSSSIDIGIGRLRYSIIGLEGIGNVIINSIQYIGQTEISGTTLSASVTIAGSVGNHDNPIVAHIWFLDFLGSTVADFICTGIPAVISGTIKIDCANNTLDISVDSVHVDIIGLVKFSGLSVVYRAFAEEIADAIITTGKIGLNQPFQHIIKTGFNHAIKQAIPDLIKRIKEPIICSKIAPFLAKCLGPLAIPSFPQSVYVRSYANPKAILVARAAYYGNNPDNVTLAISMDETGQPASRDLITQFAFIADPGTGTHMMLVFYPPGQTITGYMILETDQYVGGPLLVKSTTVGSNFFISNCGIIINMDSGNAIKADNRFDRISYGPISGDWTADPLNSWILSYT